MMSPGEEVVCPEVDGEDEEVGEEEGDVGPAEAGEQLVEQVRHRAGKSTFVDFKNSYIL